jgi:hypothetical protein
MKNLIKRIAQGCRDELQRIAPYINGNGNRAANIPQHLAGYCGYGSVLVWKRLKEAGRKPQMVQGHGHWFTICDGMLVDVTATQFGQSKVVVRDYERVQEMINSGEYRMQWWQSQRVTDSPCDMSLCANLKALDDASKWSKPDGAKNCNTCGDESKDESVTLTTC